MLEVTETAVPIIARPGDQAGTVRVVGGHSRVLVQSEQVKGAYAILEQAIPAGKGPPLHVHRQETEIFHVIPGNFGNFFQEVDAIHSDDHDAIRALAAKYDVEILE